MQCALELGWGVERGLWPLPPCKMMVSPRVDGLVGGMWPHRVVVVVEEFVFAHCYKKALLLPLVACGKTVGGLLPRLRSLLAFFRLSSVGGGKCPLKGRQNKGGSSLRVVALKSGQDTRRI